MLCIAGFDGYFKRLNPVWERTVGFTVAELCAKPFLEFVHPDDQEATIRECEQLIKGGETISFENRYLCKNGSYKWLSWNTSVSIEQQKYYAVARDITERKQEAEKLAATQERFDLAVRGSRDGLWDWNVLTNDVYYSPRMKELMGYEDHEIENILSSWESRLHPADHDRIMEALAAHVKEHIPYDVEYRLQIKTGEYRWFRARGQAIWDENGQATRVAGSISDITELKETEEALRQAQTELEARVLDRTAALEKTNATLQAEMAERARMQALTIQQGQEMLELSTPVMQVWQGIVVAPLIGTLDSQRTEQFVERLLDRIVETNSPVALVDIMGVPTIDTQTAQHLIEAITAVRILGASVVLTGVRPAIAQTLVHLGIDLSSVVTRSSLSAGLLVALETLNLHVVPKTKAQ